MEKSPIVGFENGFYLITIEYNRYIKQKKGKYFEMYNCQSKE